MMMIIVITIIIIIIEMCLLRYLGVKNTWKIKLQEIIEPEDRKILHLKLVNKFSAYSGHIAGKWVILQTPWSLLEFTTVSGFLSAYYSLSGYMQTKYTANNSISASSKI